MGFNMDFDLDVPIILSEVLGWMLGVGRPVTWRINGRGGCEPQVAHGARRLSDSEVPGLHTRTRPRPEPALPGATVAPCTPHLTSTKRPPPRDLHQEISTKRAPPKDLRQKTSTKRPPPNDLRQMTSWPQKALSSDIFSLLLEEPPKGPIL